MSCCRNITVNIAVSASAGMGGVAILLAGRSGNNLCIAVTCCGNNRLCLSDNTAYGADLTVGQTGFRTCRSFSDKSFFGMTVCLNNFLSNENFSANRAFFTVCQA